MPDPFPPRVGERFAGRYTLKARLRGGGPVVVYLADDAGHAVMLAAIDPSCGEPATLAAFSRSVAAAAGVPGLVSLGAVHGAPPGPLFCLVEQPAGVGFDALRRNGLLPWREALGLGERAAAILHAMRLATGEPHGALVAARCLLTRSPDLLILDHGIGAFEPERGRSDDGGYRAPEQLTSRGDQRSDVYSLAVILFELIAGERPSARIPTPLRSYIPGLPRQVDELFTRALHRDPRKRPADASEMRAALRELLGLGPVEEPRAASASIATAPAGPEGPPAPATPVNAPVEVQTSGETRPPSPAAPVFAARDVVAASEPRVSSARPPASAPLILPAVQMALDPLPAPSPRPALVEPPTEQFFPIPRPLHFPSPVSSNERVTARSDPPTERLPMPSLRSAAVERTEALPLSPRPRLDPTLKLPPTASTAAAVADDATSTFVRPLIRRPRASHPDDSLDGTTFVQPLAAPMNDRAEGPAPPPDEPARQVDAAAAPAGVEPRAPLTGPLLIANVVLLAVLLVAALIFAL